MSEETPAVAAPVAKKSKTGLIIGIVIAMVTLIGGSVAGAVLGPKLLGSPEDSADEGESAAAHEGSDEEQAKSSHGKGKKGKEGEKIISVEIAPIVVDLRDGDGRLRHLKVGMAAELAETANAEEFKLVSPRGREATLTYLRSLTFEEVADPTKYATIKEEISKRMISALGADKVRRILLVDFVLQ
ncbi:MAG TPA: flagellar basal body-associated FliL family protein [Polyangiaceae bacterium]|nr:flagellar basal body-associated FliL family protein [Polyangiaceae bacterium]